MESKDEQLNNEYCFTIHLRNMKDVAIDKTTLFDYHHRECLSVDYDSPYPPGYDFLLRQLAAFKQYDNLKITKIHINAIHENEEIALKQLGAELLVIYCAINGMSITQRHLLEILYDPDQDEKSVILTFDNPISLTNQLDIEIEYLMPNIHLVFTIFYHKSIITQ